MSELLDKIKSRGYWRVVIRPSHFVEKRIENISVLRGLVEKASVQLRGWDFPHLDPSREPRIDVEWIEQESQWQHYLEVWRFYQSGQFVDYSGLITDWLDHSGLIPAHNRYEPKTKLSVTDVLYRYTEIFEFTARLSLTDAGDDQMHLEISINGVQGKGRSLLLDSAKREPFFKNYVSSLDEFPYQIDIPRAKLVAESRELALKPAIELFRRFGWNPNIEVLRDIQSELTRSPNPV